MTTRSLVENLTIATKKAEELLETIYIKMDKEEARKNIKRIDIEIEAKKFFASVFSFFNMDKFTKSLDEILAIDDNVPYVEFLTNTGDFRMRRDIGITHSSGKREKVDMLTCTKTGHAALLNSVFHDKETTRHMEWTKSYDIYRGLTEEQKKRILRDFVTS
jgi:hypothetical protein